MSVVQPFDPLRVPLRGSALIEAGAGTGKTFAIVSLYLRLLLERRLDVSELLVVTYTVAATAELRTRIRERLAGLAADLSRGVPGEGPDRELAAARLEAGSAEEDAAHLANALRSFDRAAISTIHGFCQRMLVEHAFESGVPFDTELASDPGALLEEVVADFLVDRLHDPPPLFAEEAISRITPERLRALAERVASQPDVVVLPARPAPVAPPEPAVVDAWHEAMRLALACWDESSDEVMALLLDANQRKTLPPKSYTKPQLRRTWPRAIDKALARRSPGVEKDMPQLRRLTASGLDAAGTGEGPIPQHPFFEHCERLLELDAPLAVALDDWMLGVEHEFVDWVRTEVTARKRERGVLFFDDLLVQLRDALAGSRGEGLARAVRSRHPAALIDEFQDTDPVQYEIFRRVWGGGAGEEERPPLFLIGDPKQAIYAFRGADVSAYLQARDSVDAVYGLGWNYRSDPSLVAALNRIHATGPEPFGPAGIEYLSLRVPEGAADRLEGGTLRSGLRLLLAEPGDDGARDLLRGIVAEVERLLGSGARIAGEPIAARDLAILTRTNVQAREVQEALRRAGIPSVLQSEESVFATDEAGELERVMRAMAEPENPSRLYAALSTTLFSTDATRLAEWAEGRDPSGFEREASRFHRARRRWTERGFVQALRLLWAEAGVGPRLLARVDGERRATNLLHLTELLQREAVESRRGPLALLYWFGQRRAEARESGRWVAEDAQLRLESEADAVQLVTVHRSKGLEYPITFCPYLWEGNLIHAHDRFPRLHDPESGRLAVDLRREKDSALSRQALREAFAESLRVQYVALTRARHHCSAVWGLLGPGVGRSPLGHLLEPEIGPSGDPPLGNRFGKRSLDQLRASLEDLAGPGEGAIRVDELDWNQAPTQAPTPPPGPGPRPDEETGPVLPARLAARRVTRVFSRAWRVSSFSGLVQSAPDSELPESTGRETGDGHDYDAVAPAEAAVPTIPGEPVRLAEFPSGTTAGIAIHAILEQLDFGTADEPALEGLVARVLATHGMAAAFAPSLVAALRELLEVPLEPGDPESRLATLAPSDRIDEMPFELPVAGPALTPERLAEVFAVYGGPGFVRDYAERVAGLAFEELTGTLRGFVDLVLRRRGRWYLVDYKSNHLGIHATDYAPAALEQVMQEHDYVLQYHLYLVALHRHLQLRLPGYDYDEHLGGVRYLFLRGMSPGHPEMGVLRDRPSRELIEALSALFGGVG